MKIPFANPNLRVIDVARALFLSAGATDHRIKAYFSSLTAKKYILITNSCRSALFLAYAAAGAKGEVITSALTCKVAIDSIVEAGNTPIFADISLGDLNLLPEDIERKISDKTIAIQAIHLGGVACDMERIMIIARRQKLLVIEDCAQSLGATFKGKPAGSFGDVACFSLIKNAYGIGGGILATDHYDIYRKARDISSNLKTTPMTMVLFRIVRNLLDTQRKHGRAFLLYQWLMALKKDKQSYHSVKGQLCQVSVLEKKIAAHQLGRADGLQKKRKKIGRQYYDLLSKNELMKNHRFDPAAASFTKFFVYHPAINARKVLTQLKDHGIEAMHLEQKSGSPVQERLFRKEIRGSHALPGYDRVHDRLVCLPIPEHLTYRQAIEIINILKKLI